MKVRTVDVAQFTGSVFFSLTIRRPGVRAQVRDMAALEAYLAQLHAEDGKEATNVAVDLPKGGLKNGNGAVKVTKRILMGPPQEKGKPSTDPYEQTAGFLNGIKEKLTGRFGKATPSRIKEGLFVLKNELVESFEDELEKAAKTLREEYIPLIEMEYDAMKDRAKDTPVKEGGLGPLYKETDYTDAQKFANMFGLEWQWLALGVPEDLPAKLREKAAEKLESQFAEAAEEVKNALRVSFQELIAHATDKLTVKPGEKAPTFRDSLIGNIAQFCEVFEARNLMSDDALQSLVGQAKQVLTGMEPDKLRKEADVRVEAARAFATIQAELDKMIVLKPTRQFDLSED